ncbi:MAG: M23 family metallopeptidase [Halieaceae bacterium]|jgi:murein DD-endopeptidase MepM/ murein hydrolase activator NlpD|nr:M23 family metallopeptidase [Halieaceae bacterium]MBT5134673.1 M23 family metallopeptidase [Halieaceae bacterium]MBT5557370.1 M23 family metallopeptidase [Halieaceae bacterium]MDG1800604.1 M23 family metallopeptidase [Luminiphilus sp.]
MRSLTVFTLLFLLYSLPVMASEAPCPELKGDFIPGGLVWGRVEPGSQLRFVKIDVPVLSDGSFVLGLGRDAATQVDLVINERQTCTFELATREYRISRVEGVPQRTVTPPEGQLVRIRKERQLVRAAKARRIENEGHLKAVLSGLSWPATGRISGVYGSQRFYNGTPGNPHYGVDIARPMGTPVHAPGPGVVTLAEPDLFYSGGTIILDHGYGLSSSFLHMSQIDVRVGDVLETGDIMGAIGATGRATGPHLDWRMSWFNQRVDPQLLVPPMP